MGILRVKTQDESLKQTFCPRSSRNFCVSLPRSDDHLLTNSLKSHEEDENSVSTLDSTFAVPLYDEWIPSSAQGLSSTSSTTTSSTSINGRSPIVTFYKISIRRYNRIAVDHP